MILTLVLGLLLSLWGAVEGATKVSLHSTLEEINVYNSRRQSGPYLDDWNRILGRANACVSSCGSSTWLGNQLNVAWKDCRTGQTCTQTSPNAYPGRQQGEPVRDAGFVYMVYSQSSNPTDVTAAANYLNAARTTLLNQAAITGTNFTNTTKWPTDYDTDGFVQAGQVDYQITNWLRRLTYAYSYIRPGLSGGDQTTLDTWFNNAGLFWSQVMYNVLAFRFPNHLTENYTCVGTACPGSARSPTHFGGDTYYSFHDGLNNIFATHAALTGAIGVVTNQQTLKDRAKHWFKVWLQFAVDANGATADQHRWFNGAGPGKGFMYGSTVLGSMITLADHLARDGDTELMTYSATGGLFGWEGGTKTLLGAMNHFANLVIRERNLSPGPGVANYASTDATLLESELIGPDTNQAEDIYLIPANLYHKSALVTQAYTRTGMPTNPLSSGDDKWGGDWGTYPGIRFQFGQLENISNPYTETPPGTTCPVSAVCVSSDSDNAEETLAGGNTRTGPVTLELEAAQVGGVILRNLPIPPDATIDSLILAFTASTSPGSGTPTYAIAVEDSLNAPAFTAGTGNADISGRTLTGTTPVPWSPAAWTANTLNAASTTPDLKTLVQPLVNDVAWDPAQNAVAFIINTTVAGQRIIKPIGQGGLISLTYAYTPAQTGSPVLTQTHFRIGLIDVLDNTRWLAREDTSLTVPSPSCVRVRLQVSAAGGDLGPDVYKFIYSEDGGAYGDLTTNSAANLFMGGDQRFLHGAATVARLSDAAPFVPGAWLLGPGTNPPTVTLTAGDRSEWVTTACVKAGVTPGTTFDLKMARSDGTAVGGTAIPRLTVGAATAYAQ